MKVGQEFFHVHVDERDAETRSVFYEFESFHIQIFRRLAAGKLAQPVKLRYVRWRKFVSFHLLTRFIAELHQMLYDSSNNRDVYFHERRRQ
jgi:hypothetical protein